MKNKIYNSFKLVKFPKDSGMDPINFLLLDISLFILQKN